MSQGYAVWSAAGAMVEDMLYRPNKSAAESAAWGIMAGDSSSYWKYAVNLANEAGSAAQTLMKYDKSIE